MSKGLDDTAPSEGGTVVYTVTVSNAGPSDSTGVTVMDQLPTGLTYMSDYSGGAYTPGTGAWVATRP